MADYFDGPSNLILNLIERLTKNGNVGVKRGPPYVTDFCATTIPRKQKKETSVPCPRESLDERRYFPFFVARKDNTAFPHPDHKKEHHLPLWYAVRGRERRL